MHAYLLAIENKSEVCEIGQIGQISADLLSFDFSDIALGEIENKLSIWLNHCIGQKRDFPSILNVERHSLSGFMQVREASTLILDTVDEGVQA